MDKVQKAQFEHLVYFIDAACYGHTMAGSPPPLYEELKAAGKGNPRPLLEALGIDKEQSRSGN